MIELDIAILKAINGLSIYGLDKAMLFISEPLLMSFLNDISHVRTQQCAHRIDGLSVYRIWEVFRTPGKDSFGRCSEHQTLRPKLENQ